jgi:hypothetical protein
MKRNTQKIIFLLLVFLILYLLYFFNKKKPVEKWFSKIFSRGDTLLKQQSKDTARHSLAIKKLLKQQIKDTTRQSNPLKMIRNQLRKTSITLPPSLPAPPLPPPLSKEALTSLKRTSLKRSPSLPPPPLPPLLPKEALTSLPPPPLPPLLPKEALTSLKRSPQLEVRQITLEKSLMDIEETLKKKGFDTNDIQINRNFNNSRYNNPFQINKDIMNKYSTGKQRILQNEINKLNYNFKKGLKYNDEILRSIGFQKSTTLQNLRNELVNILNEIRNFFVKSDFDVLKDKTKFQKQFKESINKLSLIKGGEYNPNFFNNWPKIDSYPVKFPADVDENIVREVNQFILKDIQTKYFTKNIDKIQIDTKLLEPIKVDILPPVKKDLDIDLDVDKIKPKVAIERKLLEPIKVDILPPVKKDLDTDLDVDKIKPKVAIERKLIEDAVAKRATKRKFKTVKDEIKDAAAKRAPIPIQPIGKPIRRTQIKDAVNKIEAKREAKRATERKLRSEIEIAATNRSKNIEMKRRKNEMKKLINDVNVDETIRVVRENDSDIDGAYNQIIYNLRLKNIDDKKIMDIFNEHPQLKLISKKEVEILLRPNRFNDPNVLKLDIDYYSNKFKNEFPDKELSTLSPDELLYFFNSDIYITNPEIYFNYFKKEMPKTKSILNNPNLRQSITNSIEKLKLMIKNKVDVDSVDDLIFDIKRDAGVTDDILEKQYDFKFPEKNFKNDPIMMQNTSDQINKIFNEIIFKEIYEKYPKIKIRLDISSYTLQPQIIKTGKIREVNKEVSRILGDEENIKSILKENGISDFVLSTLFE